MSKYRDFFKNTPEGQSFELALQAKIEAYHRDSEQNPDNARDNAQKACGIRDVMLMINTMSTDSKKGRTAPVIEDVVASE